MDGVLIDAKEWHYEALNEALSLFGYTINRFDHLTDYDGLPTKTKLQKLSVEKGLPTKLHPFINEIKQQYTIAMIQRYCRPRFNHEYALSKLKFEGYHLALGSNSIRQTIELMMKYSKLHDYFDLILSNQDVEYPKPNPEIYQKAMIRLGVSPEETVIIEDNENGIKAAVASGAKVMRVGTVDDVTYTAIRSFIQRI